MHLALFLSVEQSNPNSEVDSGEDCVVVVVHTNACTPVGIIIALLVPVTMAVVAVAAMVSVVVAEYVSAAAIVVGRVNSIVVSFAQSCSETMYVSKSSVLIKSMRENCHLCTHG
jgi:hypothetical protein